MTTDVIFSDIMLDVRYWLRNDPVIGPMVLKRVFWRLPDNPLSPMILIREMPGSGPEQGAEIPTSTADIMIEIWGLENSDYTTLRQIDLALRSLIQTTGTNGSVVINPNGQTRVIWANYQSGYDSPDPDTGWPRRIAHIQLGYLPTGPTPIG